MNGTAKMLDSITTNRTEHRRLKKKYTRLPWQVKTRIRQLIADGKDQQAIVLLTK